MTKDEFFKCLDEELKNIKETIEKKNSDYTGESDDPFKNFKSTERRGIATTEQGLLTRIDDKFNRIVSLLVNKEEALVKDESVEDTLGDMAGYLILLKIYRLSKRDA